MSATVKKDFKQEQLSFWFIYSKFHDICKTCNCSIIIEYCEYICWNPHSVITVFTALTMCYLWVLGGYHIDKFLFFAGGLYVIFTFKIFTI